MCQQDATRFASDFSKAFHKVLDQDDVNKEAPHQANGCVKGRAREEAIIVRLITGYKLKKAGITSALLLYDCANAFPSVDHGALDRVLDEDNPEVEGEGHGKTSSCKR